MMQSISQTGTHVGWVKTQDGTSIPFYSYGTGYPICIFNGFSCIQENVKYLIQYFRTSFRVISWDYKGHGNAPKPNDLNNISIEAFIDDVQRVLAANEISEAILIGYSMGAQLMFEWYKRFPHMATALISLNGITGKAFDFMFNSKGAFSPLVQFFTKRQHHYPEQYQKIWDLTFSTPNWLKLLVAGIIGVNPSKTEKKDIEPFFDHFLYNDPKVMLKLASELHDHSVKDFLPKVKAPTLFIAGEKDLLAPHHISEKAHSMIPDSEMILVPEGTHNSPLEQYDFLCSVMHEFIQRRVPNLKCKKE